MASLSPTPAEADDASSAAGPPGHHVRRRRRRLRLLLKLGAAIATLATAATVGVGIYAYRYYQHNPACDPRQQTAISLGRTSFITAADGSALGAVPTTIHREPVPATAISPWLPKALIAIEDRRFFEHSGVDWKGIARAGWRDFQAGRVLEGGSTITQQLARNIYRTGGERTLTRKIREACLALKLDRSLSKQQILTEYLNQVYLGAGAYGVEAAAHTYFDRPAAALTLPQAALIAGMPQAPSGFDPFRYPDRARERRAYVLDALLQTRVITLPQWRWARSTPLGLVRGGRYLAMPDEQALRAVLVEVQARVGRTAAVRGGLEVRTTIDPRLQAAARATVRSMLRAGDPSAAVVAIDPATGAIRALVSVSNSGPLEFNLAWQGRRQAGSAFKPFAFAAALEHGIDTGSTYYLSSPLDYITADGTKWEVRNNESTYLGGVSLDRALARSDNTVFSRLTLDLGPAAVAAQARKLGIRSPLAAVPSITLGVNPVSPLEMASAYATLAAGGVYHQPTLIAEITRRGGKVERPLARPGSRVLSADIAAQATRAMVGVVESGSGKAAALAGRPVAGKTGTTTDFTDAWFVGFTPELATAVWVGYPRRAVSMESVQGITVYGGTFPARIWQEFMTQALVGTPVQQFPEPLAPPSWPWAPPRWRGYYGWKASGGARDDATRYAAWQSRRVDEERRSADDRAERLASLITQGLRQGA